MSNVWTLYITRVTTFFISSNINYNDFNKETFIFLIYSAVFDFILTLTLRAYFKCVYSAFNKMLFFARFMTDHIAPILR